MAEKAEILIAAVIDDLAHIERHLRELAAQHETRVLETKDHISDSIAQMVKPSKDPDRPIRKNGSFLPLPSFSRSC